nr:PIG-L family deacetylase [Candidatus Woesebacteria bacterium]
MKKPSLVAIFAHPDDEAFGPAGTLAKYAETHDVYIICATCGEAGENHADAAEQPLGEIRKEELRRSAAILSVEDVFFLGYKDGTLSNNQYHAIAEDIRKIADEFEPEIFLTYENRGVSGHLDHVAMSLITHYVFHQVTYAKQLLSYILLKDATDQLRNYFIYVPHGYDREDVDLVVNTSAYWETK